MLGGFRVGYSTIPAPRPLELKRGKNEEEEEAGYGTGTEEEEAKPHSLIYPHSLRRTSTVPLAQRDTLGQRVLSPKLKECCPVKVPRQSRVSIKNYLIHLFANRFIFRCSPAALSVRSPFFLVDGAWTQFVCPHWGSWTNQSWCGHSTGEKGRTSMEETLSSLRNRFLLCCVPPEPLQNHRTTKEIIEGHSSHLSFLVMMVFCFFFLRSYFSRPFFPPFFFW